MKIKLSTVAFVHMYIV